MPLPGHAQIDFIERKGTCSAVTSPQCAEPQDINHQPGNVCTDLLMGQILRRHPLSPPESAFSQKTLTYIKLTKH